MLPADPSLSAAERVDAACDRFESEWRGGTRPNIADFVAAAPEPDREALRQALLALEIELQGRSGAETSVTRSSVRTGDDAPPTDATAAHPGGTAPAVGTIGRFEIRSVLGAGAFGKVYRAFDPHLGREVAVKVPLAEAVQSERERALFLKEARAAANINHPNICQVHEVGEAGGRPYIVMALVRGQSLADTIKARREPLPVKQAALVARKIALALAAAHDSGVVHRDLKPANVMFDRERKDIVVMDFGLARGPRFGDARGTQSGVIMGTPAYMSPEQARGDSKGVGPAGDVFSLGVILYELLTGTRPFTGTATEVIGQILHVDPEKPSAVRPGIDPRLEAVCLKAMAKDPAARFGTMQQFAAAIDAVLRAAAPTGPAADEATATRRDGDDQGTRNALAEVFVALSDDRKQARAETAAAIDAALARHRTPRWVLLLTGVLFAGGLTALAGVVFFTRSDKVKVTIELTDVDLADQSLSFFLDDEPVTAEALAGPVELKPGEHVLVVKRGKDIVKRMLLTVSGGRSPGIKVKDITPPAGEPVKPVRSGEWRDLLGEVDAAQLPLAWKLQGGTLVGRRDAEGNPNWLMWQFGEGVAGDYELEFDFRFLDSSPVLLFVPLNDATICAEITRGGSALQTIDGTPADEGRGLVNFAPGTSNQQARTANNTLHSVTALVRHHGADVDVVMKLDGAEIGHFVGARSRLSQPDWIKPKPGQIKVAATSRKGATGWFEVHKLRVRSVAAADDLTRLQGRWRRVVAVIDGGERAAEELRNRAHHSVVAGDTIQHAVNGHAYPASRFRIDPSKAPKEFDTDVVEMSHPGGPFRHCGVYELDGDRLRLCCRFKPVGQPIERATWADRGKNGVFYFEYVRDKTRDLDRWQGAWQCVTENSWGKVVYENDRTRKGPVQVITGDTRDVNKISAGADGPVGASRFRINDAVTPKTFDCDAFGPGRWHQSGTYEFAGDRLRLVYRFAKDAHPARATWADIGKPDVHYYEFERVPGDAFVPLFNGKDLSGWRSVGEPKWSWTDGRLLGSPGATPGYLVTSAEYRDFELELEYRLGAGAGSGLFLRTDADGLASGKKQLEVQIADDGAFPTLAPAQRTGAVYNVFPRTSDPPVRRNDWNTLRVRLNGRRIEVWVNGTQTVDADLDTARDKSATVPGLARPKGGIALQQNQQANVEFRNIRIKQLSQ